MFFFLIFSVNFQGSNVCGFFFALCVNFQIQFDSLAFQLTLNAMKTKQTVERTLIIPTSKTLRLVVAISNTRRGSFSVDFLLFPTFATICVFNTQKHSSSSSSFFSTCLLLSMIFCSFVFFFFCFLFAFLRRKCVNWWFCVSSLDSTHAFENERTGRAEIRKTLKGIMRISQGWRMN